MVSAPVPGANKAKYVYLLRFGLLCIRGGLLCMESGTIKEVASALHASVCPCLPRIRYGSAMPRLAQFDLFRLPYFAPL